MIAEFDIGDVIVNMDTTPGIRAVLDKIEREIGRVAYNSAGKSHLHAIITGIAVAKWRELQIKYRQSAVPHKIKKFGLRSIGG